MMARSHRQPGSPVKFGLCLPSHLWQQDLPERQATLAAIADAGFDLVYMADHVSFRNGAGTDGFVAAAGLSQLHATLGVMISIYLLPLRHPLPVARQLATMAELAPGRFTFGIGVGGEDRHEVEVCGVDPRTRGARTNDALAIIRELMGGANVTHHGAHFELDEARIRPTPKAAIPIIVGGRSDAALARVARFGDGWIGVWVSPSRYAAALAYIAEQADAAGRAATPWQHGYQPWVGVDSTSSDRARQVVAEQMERFYHVPFEKFERYTPHGSPTEVAEQLLAYAAAGSQLFNLKICAQHPEEEVALAAEVLAEMRRMQGA